LFKIEEIRLFVKTHEIKPIELDIKLGENTSAPKITKGMRNSTLVRIKYRDIAERKWDNDGPPTTISAMIKVDEIKKVAVNKSGKPYKDRTIRNWIKDLAPDHSPGRRPKKSNRD
jgi:hypothetical protein